MTNIRKYINSSKAINNNYKKIYKFGFVTGIFLLEVALFLIFSLVYFFDKLKFFEFFSTIIVIIISIGYFIKYTINNVKYQIDEENLIVFCPKYVYILKIGEIILNNLLFDIQKQIIFNDTLNNNEIKKIVVDSDIIKGNHNKKRLLWYTVYIILSILIVIGVIYSIIK